MSFLNTLARNNQRAAFITGALALLSLAAAALLVWSGQSALVGPTYLASAFLIGSWLYASSSPLYLGFVVWLWFLTPFLRRVIDYAVVGSYTPPSQSLVLLTPFAVTILTLIDIPRYGGQLLHRRYLPYFLCLLGVLYGYLVGLVKVGPFGATRQLLAWLPPLLTGFYVLNRWHLSNQHIQVLKRTLTWGVLILGLYGILQFHALPAWDAFWMRSAEMNSIGQPYPHQVRIFSMLDSPGPFAVSMTTGLILLFAERGFLPLIAAVPGYASFLVVGVRGAWIGWMVAVGTIISQVTGQLRSRLIMVLVAVTVITIPVILTSPMAERTTNRVETFEDIERDGSVKARVRLYSNAPFRIMMNPVGWGLGSRSMDSGILMLFWQLGWPGSFLYLSGLALLFRDVLHGGALFNKIVIGIAAAYGIQFFAGGQLLSQVSGVLFWSLTSLSIAAHIYQVRQRQAAAA